MAEKYGLGWKIEYVRVYTYNKICYDSLERILQEWKQQWREKKAASTNKSSKERTQKTSTNEMKIVNSSALLNIDKELCKYNDYRKYLWLMPFLMQGNNSKDKLLSPRGYITLHGKFC